MGRPYDSPLAATRRLTIVALVLIFAPLPAMAQVTVYTVGPYGTYGNIQAAVGAAVIGADTEIRVERGSTYFESLVIPGAFDSGSIDLIGGWDSTFTTRSDDPRDTVIDGNGARVVDVLLGGGSFGLDGFHVINGTAYQGAGVRVLPAGDAQVTMSNVRIEGNTASAPGAAAGGGLWVELDGAGRVEVLSCRIRDNQAISTGGGLASGGGLSIDVSHGASFLIQGSEIDENAVESSGGQAHGGGVYVIVADGAQGDLLDSYPVGNSATGASVVGSGGYLWVASSASQLNVERTGWVQNQAPGFSGEAQVGIVLQGGTFRLRDSGVAWGDDDGIGAIAAGSGDLNLVNLTVADNAGNGLVLQQSAAASLTLYNSIVYDNGTDLFTAGSIDAGFNLVGVDPSFLDPSRMDYHLRIGSQAENAGENDPPGGLGAIDFDGNPRI